MKPFSSRFKLALSLATAATLTVGSSLIALADQPAKAGNESTPASRGSAEASKENSSEGKESAPASKGGAAGSKGGAAGSKESASPQAVKEGSVSEASSSDPPPPLPTPAPSSTPTVIVTTGEYSVDGDDKEHDSERKEIESILTMIETQWNAHDIKAVMSNYADDYINNDGLDRKAVQKLTEDFWKTYPDAHAISKTKQIRIEGNFVTVESRDISVATCDMQGMSKGELQSVSEGQQYFKHLGNTWKIIGDRIDYEKVRVAFGLAKQLNAVFTAPEQVKSGKQFSARLEVTLPPGFRAIGSITNQPLTFPQHTPMEKTRELSDQPPVLERVMPANGEGRNELLTATVILVNPVNKPMGLAILTRRLNVIPDSPETPDTTTAQESSGKDKIVSETSKESKDSSKIESASEKSSAEKNSAEKSGAGKSTAEKSTAEKNGEEKTSADKDSAEKSSSDKSPAPSK